MIGGHLLQAPAGAVRARMAEVQRFSPPATPTANPAMTAPEVKLDRNVCFKSARFAPFI